ncbi:MAG: hypothetical protein LKM39_14450 [Chiayiivirga sp.]|jgi:hypothetical protein|nr:hypothetical protein [Chiayiivirga sp.]
MSTIACSADRKRKRGFVIVWLTIFACSLLTAMPALAQTSRHNLRVEPPIPTAGEPFMVAVDGSACDLFFVGVFEGFTYGGTRTLGSVVEARFGHAQYLPCDLPTTTVRQPAGGLPAGQYRLDLISEPSGTPQFEAVLESIVFTVAPGTSANASAVAVPTMGTWGSVVLLLAIGAVIVRRRAHQH